MPDPKSFDRLTESDLEPMRGSSLALADSLDIRFLVAGKLSQAAIPLRRERAELAEVLGQERRASKG